MTGMNCILELRYAYSILWTGEAKWKSLLLCSQNSQPIIKNANSSIREAEAVRLRWPYFEHLFEQSTQHQPCSFLFKAAIPYADGQNEIMWFIPEMTNTDSFYVILINKPIYVQHMQENGRYTLSYDQIKHWTVGAQSGNITANNACQLISIL